MNKELEKKMTRDMNLAQATMSSDAYWQTNKKIARKMGLDAAVLIADLMSKHRYHAERGEINACGEFFYTVEDMETYTTLTKHLQGKALRKLRNAKMIEQHTEGLPARRWFKINYTEIVDWMSTDEEELKSQNEE